jgi:hypothetical protein
MAAQQNIMSCRSPHLSFGIYFSRCSRDGGHHTPGCNLMERFSGSYPLFISWPDGLRVYILCCDVLLSRVAGIVEAACVHMVAMFCYVLRGLETRGLVCRCRATWSLHWPRVNIAQKSVLSILSFILACCDVMCVATDYLADSL